MSDEPFFLDTNILVYARDSRDANKQRVAAELIERAISSGQGRISVQVLEEFYRTVTGKLSPGIPRKDARKAVKALEVLRPAPIDGELLEAAWTVEDSAKLSWWDALIVAAASRERCLILYSEDLSHGMRIGSVEVRNPFRRAAE